MMKEYGEIENDLKLVQSICKNKQEKYLLLRLKVFPFY